MMIMMNLKQLRFKIFSEEPQKAQLKVSGEKEVRGADFEIPAQLELINPDCHIATLTSKSAEIEMEILIKKGMGYLSREEKKTKEKPAAGVILLDAIFTPIRRVGFKSENMRVGERTDFDKLSLEIETDGTIAPEDAFSRAVEILILQLSLLAGTFETKKAEEIEGKSPKAETKKKKRAPSKKYAKEKKRKKI